jgi:hypothetical protein
VGPTAPPPLLLLPPSSVLIEPAATHRPATQDSPEAPHSCSSVPLSMTPSQSSSKKLQVSTMGIPGVQMDDPHPSA